MDTYKVHKKTSVLNIRLFPPKAAPIFRPDFRSTDIVKYNKITHLTLIRLFSPKTAPIFRPAILEAQI